MKIKKKLRDITAKEYAKWKAKVCIHPIKCNTCLFNSVVVRVKNLGLIIRTYTQMRS